MIVMLRETSCRLLLNTGFLQAHANWNGTVRELPVHLALACTPMGTAVGLGKSPARALRLETRSLKPPAK